MNDLRREFPAAILSFIAGIGNNPDMGVRWFLLAGLILLLAGCTPQSAAVSPQGGATDDFGLPLVIVIKAPEVPKELEGPSPPIEVGSKATPPSKTTPSSPSPKPLRTGH